MKNKGLWIFLLLLSLNIFSEDYSAVEQKINELNNKVDMIQSNQINYQIEKTLLKDTYETNYQTVNLILTIILAVFTIISFLGFRDISTLRNEYKKELEELKKTKEIINNQVIEIKEKQEAIVKDSFSLKQVNEEQNNRIRILEIQEKANTFMDQKNYSRALEYILIGLELNSINSTLLSQSATCYWKLFNYTAAIEAFEKLVGIDPKNADSYNRNLSELYLFTLNFEKFEKLITDNPLLHKNYGEELKLNDYLEILQIYVKKQNVTTNILNKLKVIKNEKQQHINWRFEELYDFLSNKIETKNKKSLMLFTEVLSGEKLPQEVITEVVKLGKK